MPARRGGSRLTRGRGHEIGIIGVMGEALARVPRPVVRHR
jgi:hypothetical protein